MPTYYRPKVAYIDPGGRGTGALVLIAAVLAAAAAVVAFIVGHPELLAVCAAVFVTVMGGIIAAMRWVASPARLRRQLHPRYTAPPIAARPAQALPAARRAIEAPRTLPAAAAVNRERARRVR